MTKQSTYVRDSEARKVAAGARIISRLTLSPEAVEALTWLQNEGYAGSVTACINQALIRAKLNEQRVKFARGKTP